MTLEEFTRHAEAWGADIARWPDGVRAAAMQMANSSEARAILAAQRRLDTALTAAAPAIAQARIDRATHAVLTRLAQEQPRTRLADLLSRWFIPAVGLACAGALGALAAFAGPLADAGPDDMRGLFTMIFDANLFGQGWIVL